MPSIILIEDEIASLRKKYPVAKVATILDTSTSMVAKYRQTHRIPSISVAISLFTYNGKVLHPYSIDSLLYEIKLQQDNICSNCKYGESVLDNTRIWCKSPVVGTDKGVSNSKTFSCDYYETYDKESR